MKISILCKLLDYLLRFFVLTVKEIVSSYAGLLNMVEDGSKKTTFFQKLRFLQRILGGNRQKGVVKKGEYFTGGGGRGIDVCSQLQRDGIEDWEAYLDDLERRTSKPDVSLNVASTKVGGRDN